MKEVEKGMSKSDFEHEYLFVLGNGASIASADSEWDNHLKLKPSIENIIPFELSDLMDESHFEALKGLIKKVIEISGRKGERHIVRFFEALRWLLKKLIKISGRREGRNIVRLLVISK
ncbi:MAG: hypothetical protein MUC72_10380 [Acidobacteria bacterium]|nr:hypothetical protein [Acidobacteriota bacterium]